MAHVRLSNPHDTPPPFAVLIVEDQRSQAEMLGAMVRKHCACEVVIAANYAQSKQILDERGSDFMVSICDVNLPDAPYGEVIDLVCRYNMPAVALTGTITNDVRSMVRSGAIVDYVLKKGIVSYEYVTQLVRRLQRNRSIKVVVADDSLASRDVLQRMLHIQGLNVLTAENGAEAIQMLEQHPDTRLVLVDYNMPKVDGFEFVLQARRIMGKDKLAIIGISGEDRPDVSAQFLKHGANDFISKPYSYEEMTCRINQNLEMLELVESLHHMATRDHLTDLSNRRTFFDRGDHLLQQARTAQHAVGLAMMDVDHFKSINDNHGHQMGDKVLQTVATELQRHFAHNLVARLGGEEFAVLFTDNSTEAALRERLEDFRELLPAAIATHYPHIGPITMSIGLCCANDTSLNDLLLAADSLLYQSKSQGRNRLL